MFREVSHHQFNIEGDLLTHVPAGARFRMSETDIVLCDWPPAADAAVDFDRDEVMRAAKELLEFERTRCL
jgi:hypothetical protein